MMYKFFILFVVIIFSNIINANFAFPEENPVVSTQNKDDKKPLFVPGACPPNYLLYPGDQESDYVCDCQPSFVYYPKTDECVEVYRQGPCNKGEYIILRKSEVNPSCVRNPCGNDTIVPFEGKCAKLYKKDACPAIELGGGTLGVNATTLEIECIPGTVELNLIKIPPTCPPGSKRMQNGSCRKVVRSVKN